MPFRNKEREREYQREYYLKHRDALLPQHRVTGTRSYYKRRIAKLEAELEHLKTKYNCAVNALVQDVISTCKEDECLESMNLERR
jgi:hypothetical protein